MSRSFVRYVWASPTTTLGLIVLLVGFRRARVQVVDGVLEAHSPSLAWMLTHLTLLPGGAAAMTLGHVVVARDAWTLDWARAHERVHVRQAETWGPFFIPAYLAASAFALMRGGHPYRDNPFEAEAFNSTELR